MQLMDSDDYLLVGAANTRTQLSACVTFRTISARYIHIGMQSW